MKKLLLIAFVLILSSCEKEKIEEIIVNIPDTEAQIVYSVKLINSNGSKTEKDDFIKLRFNSNTGSLKTPNITNAVVGSGNIISYPETFDLGKKKQASLKVESNLFDKGWTIEADITKITKSGGTVSLKKQTMTANGEITVMSID